MKKTIIISTLLLAVAFFYAIDADAQKNHGKKSGKHNNSQMHNCPNFADANGDGKCDSFVDANGDGKCDNCTNADCTGSCDGKMGKGKHGHKCSNPSNPSAPSNKMLGSDEKSLATNISASPMPATNEVKINFTLEQAGTVSVDVFDRTGNKVANVFSGNLDAKDHSFVANTANYANGTYFFRITVNGQQTTQKMLISK